MYFAKFQVFQVLSNINEIIHYIFINKCKNVLILLTY